MWKGEKRKQILIFISDFSDNCPLTVSKTFYLVYKSTGMGKINLLYFASLIEKSSGVIQYFFIRTALKLSVLGVILVRMRENADQSNSKHEQISCIVGHKQYKDQLNEDQ